MLEKEKVEASEEVRYSCEEYLKYLDSKLYRWWRSLKEIEEVYGRSPPLAKLRLLVTLFHYVEQYCAHWKLWFTSSVEAYRTLLPYASEFEDIYDELFRELIRFLNKLFEMDEKIVKRVIEVTNRHFDEISDVEACIKCLMGSKSEKENRKEGQPMHI